MEFQFSSRASSGPFDGFSVGRYEEKRESFDLFLLRGLQAERCDFLGENRSGAGALSKRGFLPCPSIIRNSKRRTQNPSKSLKKPLLRQKDDDIPQVR